MVDTYSIDFHEALRISGRKRPSPVVDNESRPRSSTSSLKMSCDWIAKSPRSIIMTAQENRLLRMPDSGLMLKQQSGLQTMLVDIYEDPDGFSEFIEDMRGDMGTSQDYLGADYLESGSLEDYHIQESIGKGRFSVVYRARRIRDNMICAVKKIDLSMTQNSTKQSFSKCVKEVGLLRSLEHENVVRYCDSFLNGHELFIVLEWARNGDLKMIIDSCKSRSEKMSEGLVWKYFSQCCGAVGHMHENRIMHRDIKPSNIFVKEDGGLLLGDLGLGRYLDTQSIMAFSQVGTPLYMSPEVLRGEGHDFASDVWSLGCLLYELVMLRSPFLKSNLTLHQLFQNIVTGQYPRLTASYSVEETRALVEAMVEVDAKKRAKITAVSRAASVALARVEKLKRAVASKKTCNSQSSPNFYGEQQQQQVTPGKSSSSRNEKRSARLESTSRSLKVGQVPSETTLRPGVFVVTPNIVDTECFSSHQSSSHSSPKEVEGGAAEKERETPINRSRSNSLHSDSVHIKIGDNDNTNNAAAAADDVNGMMRMERMAISHEEDADTLNFAAQQPAATRGHSRRPRGKYGWATPSSVQADLGNKYGGGGHDTSVPPEPPPKFDHGGTKESSCRDPVTSSEGGAIRSTFDMNFITDERPRPPCTNSSMSTPLKNNFTSAASSSYSVGAAASSSTKSNLTSTSDSSFFHPSSPVVTDRRGPVKSAAAALLRNERRSPQTVVPKHNPRNTSHRGKSTQVQAANKILLSQKHETKKTHTQDTAPTTKTYPTSPRSSSLSRFLHGFTTMDRPLEMKGYILEPCE